MPLAAVHPVKERVALVAVYDCQYLRDVTLVHVKRTGGSELATGRL
jgi:hypothetical protein